MTSRRPPSEVSEPYDYLELVERWVAVQRQARCLDADPEVRADLAAVTADLAAIVVAVPRAGALIDAAHRRLDALEAALLRGSLA